MNDDTRWWLRKLRHAVEDGVIRWDDAKQRVPWEIDRDIRYYARELGKLPGMEELANEAYRVGAYDTCQADYVTLLNRIWAYIDGGGDVSQKTDTGI